MMLWSHYGMSGWGWFVTSTSMVLLCALIIIGGFLLFRSLRHTAEPDHHHAARSPEQLLAERFARGDIDGPEYQQRLSTLRSTAPGPPLTKDG